MSRRMFMRSTLISCVLKSYIFSRMKKMASRFGLLTHYQRFLFADSLQRSAAGACLTFSSLGSTSYFSNTITNYTLLCRSRAITTNLNVVSRQHHSQKTNLRARHSGGGWSGDENGRQRFPVKLMDFPEKTMPDIVKSFRNRFFAFLIRSYYDATFTLDGFLEAATQAAACVSAIISEGNFADLKGLVVDEAVQEIQNNYADLTYQQRKWLRISPSDIIGKFVYEIGMMFDDDTDQRFVEITVVLHGCHDLADCPESATDMYSHLQDNPRKFFVCNYRFIREFTKGVDGSWTINKLNHFLPFAPEDEDSSRM